MANPTPDVRAARAADVPAAVRLLRRQLDAHDIALADARLEEAVRGTLHRPELARLFVATVDGEPVGVAVLSFLWTLEHGGPAAWLEELYVEPAHRGRGLGRRLVELVLDEAAAAGSAALDLEVEPGHDAAERLYARMGFHRHPRMRWARALAARGRAAARPIVLFDHVSLGVNDLARSKAFYDAVLAPLGLVPYEQIPGEVAYAPAGSPPQDGCAFYIGFEDPAARRHVAPSAGFHVAFRAPTRAAVRDFHRIALASGGTDNGAPGLRPYYQEHYYGGFVCDPDGHHVEAVCYAEGDE